MSDYYDRKGNPISFDQYVAIVRNDPEAKRVALTRIGDARISTVWLGLDHSWGGGPPTIFETMVFGGPLDGEMDRYGTEEGAVRGHAAMVERCRAPTPPENKEDPTP